jgi:hypothetical protein
MEWEIMLSTLLDLFRIVPDALNKKQVILSVRSLIKQAEERGYEEGYQARKAETVMDFCNKEEGKRDEQKRISGILRQIGTIENDKEMEKVINLINLQ